METTAVLEQRELAQERKLQLIQFWNDIEVRARQVVSGEDDTKRPLAAFRASVLALRISVSRWSDSVDNLGDIQSDIRTIKQRLGELVALDTNSSLAWAARNLRQSCDSFLVILEEKLPDSRPKPAQARDVNPHRATLLNEIDELSARMMSLGDDVHGGLEARRPVVAAALALRRLVAADPTGVIDSARIIEEVELIKASAHELASVRSRLTRESGFMMRSMPIIDKQCDSIISMLRKLVVPARLKGSLSIRD